MSDPGKFAPGLTGFPAPEAADEVQTYLLFLFPDSLWAQYILGACENLVYPWNWYDAGGMTPDEAAEEFRLIVQQAPYNLRVTTVDTPFWDDSTDVEDEESIESQGWYGEVSNPTAPPDELNFIENALVWFFTGLVALATPELGFAPAILFHTIAPKFLLAQKRGDFAETIRILIDGQDAATVDTSSYSPGDIIQTPIIANPDLSDHTLMIIATRNP